MDARTELQKRVDKLVGRPLYYCSACQLAVDVSVKGEEIEIKRPCDCEAEIIAPRRAIAAGIGGLNLADKIKLSYWKIAARLTGRCV